MTRINRISMNMSSWEEHKQRRLKAKKEKKRFLIGMHIVQLLCVLTLTIGIFVLQSPPRQHQLQNLPSTIVANAKNRRNNNNSNNNNGNKKLSQPTSTNTNTTATSTSTKTTKLKSLRNKNPHPLHYSTSTPKDERPRPRTTTTSGKSKSKIPVTQVTEDLLEDEDNLHGDNVNSETWIEENLARTYRAWPLELKYSWCQIPATSTPHDSSDDNTNSPALGKDLEEDNERAGPLKFVKTNSYDSNDSESSLSPSTICANVTLNIAHRIGDRIQQERQEEQQEEPISLKENGSTSTSSVSPQTPSSACDVHIIDHNRKNNGTAATPASTKTTRTTSTSSFLWTIVHKPSQIGFWNSYYGNRDQSSANIQNTTVNDDNDDNDYKEVKADEEEIQAALEEYKNMQYNQLMTMIDPTDDNTGSEDGGVKSSHRSNLRRRRLATVTTPDSSSRPISNVRHNAIAHNRHIINRSKKGGKFVRDNDGRYPMQRSASNGSTRIRATYGSKKHKTASLTAAKSNGFGSAVPPLIRTSGNRVKTSLVPLKYRKDIKGIFNTFDFIAVADRLDESLVALKLLLRLDHFDVLHLKQESINHTVQEPKHGNANICRTDTVEKSLLPEKNLLSKDLQIQNQVHPYVTRYESNIDVLLYEVASKSLDKTIQSLNGSSINRDSRTTNTIGSVSGSHSIEDDREKILQQRLQAHDRRSGGLFDKEYREYMIWQNIIDEYCFPKSTKTIVCPTDSTHASDDDGESCYVNQLGCGDDCVRHIWQTSNGNLKKALEMFPSSSTASTS